MTSRISGLIKRVSGESPDAYDAFLRYAMTRFIPEDDRRAWYRWKAKYNWDERIAKLDAALGERIATDAALIGAIVQAPLDMLAVSIGQYIAERADNKGRPPTLATIEVLLSRLATILGSAAVLKVGSKAALKSIKEFSDMLKS